MLKLYRHRDICVYVMYYVYVTSGPSLLDQEDKDLLKDLPSRMLHIRNTLHKHIIIARKRYTFRTSNLHHRVARVILHLDHLPLQGTTVYTRNQGCRKLHFRVLLLLLESLPRKHKNFFPSSVTSLVILTSRIFE